MLLFLFCKFLQVYGLKSINQGLLVAANDFPKIPNIFFQISVNSLNFKCALCWLSKHHYYPWGHVNYDCWGMLDSVWFSNKMMDTSEECLLKKRYHLKQRATSTFFFTIFRKIPKLSFSDKWHISKAYKWKQSSLSACEYLEYISQGVFPGWWLTKDVFYKVLEVSQGI